MDTLIKMSYVSSYSFKVKDIENPYSDENKELYINKIKENLFDISQFLNDKMYMGSFIYTISEVYDSTNTVILSLDGTYNKNSEVEISEKQIIV